MTPDRRSTDLLGLVGMTLGALAVHGYHPGVEDAEIYLPGILKQLQPALFPHNSQFFASHAGMTLFPRLMAGSIRVAHLSAGTAMLVCQILSIFLTLWACHRIARVCFSGQRRAVWCGVALVASLLTIPVAGTSLYILDQYVTARSLSTPFSLLAVAAAVENRPWSAGVWTTATLLVHPLMTAFTVAYLLALLVARLDKAAVPDETVVASLLPMWLFEPPPAAYARILETRPLHLITNWAWYEWLGVFAPLLLLTWIGRASGQRGLRAMQWVCRSLVVFGLVFLAIALVISTPGRFEQLSELQPMRSLHLVYTMLFLLGGGWIGLLLLRTRPWRWALLFVPLCFGMWFAQRQLFAASPHLEVPWIAASNPWVEAFEWIRTNTPVDAYFVLNPQHMALPGEDEHGFRAIAERSRLADAVKDSGAASMFPQLADLWAAQVDAQADWKHIDRAGLLRLRAGFGVTWVVLEQPGIPGLPCPYANTRLLVCRIE